MKHVHVNDSHGTRRVTMLWDTCATCGVWLPLGPSDETQVAVEVRAADLSNLARSYASTSESHGWALAQRDADLPAGLEEDPEYLAGYYARVIFEHDDEQEEAAARAVAREVRDSIEPNGVRLKGQR
jgi:hypothetical protein